MLMILRFGSVWINDRVQGSNWCNFSCRGLYETWPKSARGIFVIEPYYSIRGMRKSHINTSQQRHLHYNHFCSTCNILFIYAFVVDICVTVFAHAPKRISFFLKNKGQPIWKTVGDSKPIKRIWPQHTIPGLSLSRMLQCVE